MNARIESLIVKVINGSDTLKAIKTCVENGEIAGFPRFEWIDAVNPKSNPFSYVELGMQRYLQSHTDREIEATWDETLAEHISDNPYKIIDICLYARNFAETWAALNKMRIDTNGDRDSFLDALTEYADSFR